MIADVMYAEMRMGLTLKEIGKVWGMSESGVWRKLRRAGYPTRDRKQARSQFPEKFGKGCRKGAPNAGRPRKVSP